MPEVAKWCCVLPSVVVGIALTLFGGFMFFGTHLIGPEDDDDRAFGGCGCLLMVLGLIILLVVAVAVAGYWMHG